MNAPLSEGATKALEIHQEQKQALVAVRAEFFNNLIEEWSRSPEPIDQVMGQQDAFLVPDFCGERASDPGSIFINDAQRGLLAVSVTPPDSWGTGLRLVYSIFQAGDWLRYGVLVQGPPRMLMVYEQHQDSVLSMERIWDRHCDHQVRDEAGLLFEWRFVEPDFYTNYIIRERFLNIARHFHFRLGKIILPLSPHNPADPNDPQNN